jgi:hypothetical protein
MTEKRKAQKPTLEEDPMQRQRRGRDALSGRQHGRFFQERTAESFIRSRHVLRQHRGGPVKAQR